MGGKDFSRSVATPHPGAVVESLNHHVRMDWPLLGKCALPDAH